MKRDYISSDCEWRISKFHQFPVVLDKLKQIEKETKNIKLKNKEESSIKQNYCKWELNIKGSLLLFFLLIQNSICCSIETSMIIWYNKYMITMYNQTILFCTLQLGLFSIGLILSTELVKQMNNKYVRYDDNNNINSGNNSQRYNINYLFAMIGYIGMIVMSSILYPMTIDNINSSSNNLFSSVILVWIYAILFGFANGIALMTTKMILVEIQPKNITGVITGIKGFITVCFDTINILIIGLIWNQTGNPNCLFYVMATQYALCTVLMLFSMSLKQCL